MRLDALAFLIALLSAAPAQAVILAGSMECTVASQQDAETKDGQLNKYKLEVGDTLRLEYSRSENGVSLLLKKPQGDQLLIYAVMLIEHMEPPESDALVAFRNEYYGVSLGKENILLQAMRGELQLSRHNETDWTGIFTGLSYQGGELVSQVSNLDCLHKLDTLDQIVDHVLTN